MQVSLFSSEQEEKYVETTLHTEPNCFKCGMHKSSKTPKLPISGNGKRNILSIGNFSEFNDDQTGNNLASSPGEFFKKELTRIGLNFDEDFQHINALGCFPGRTKTNTLREPSDAQIQHCFPRVATTIFEQQPKFIWLLGEYAIKSVIGMHFSNTSESRWRGTCIPDRTFNAFLLPIFSPSAVYDKRHIKNNKTTFQRDLKFAKQCLKREFPTPRPEKIVKVTDYEQVISLLTRTLTNEAIFYFDYEANSLLPYMPGFKLLSISFCCDGKTAYTLPLEYRDFWNASELNAIYDILRKILTSDRIGKIAHNMKYEDLVTRYVLGEKVHPFDWDSELAAHILDNRPKFTALKFQTFLEFGIPPWNNEINPFIKSGKDNHFNRLESFPLDKLLHYGGKDSLYGYWLTEKQEEKFKQHVKKGWTGITGAYDLFHDATVELADIEVNGICVDEEYYKIEEKRLNAKAAELMTEIMGSTEAEQFYEVNRRPIDVGSTQDLGCLFYDIMNITPILTDKGNRTVDEIALKLIGIPFTDAILKYRKVTKVVSTYIAQIQRAIFDGRIHPWFSLTIPVSYRSSAQRPSFQNFPKHDPEAMQSIRGGIKPSPGFRLGEVDFSSIEVNTGCLYHKDPNMITYCTDPSTDMHRDTAMDLFLLQQAQISKSIRYAGKNGWVFAQFYGSYYKQCAKNIWRDHINEIITWEDGTTITVREHLKTKGIVHLDDFVNHCKLAEDIFWKQRFKVYNEWKSEINELFCDQGFLETYFGFRFQGLIGAKEATNYPIQSTAFHILLWSLIQMNRELKQRKLKTKATGQIHDSMLLDIYPPETLLVIQIAKEICEVRTQKAFSWLTIPLEVEIELSEIDGDFAHMTEWKE